VVVGVGLGQSVVGGVEGWGGEDLGGACNKQTWQMGIQLRQTPPTATAAPRSWRKHKRAIKRGERGPGHSAGPHLLVHRGVVVQDLLPEGPRHLQVERGACA